VTLIDEIRRKIRYADTDRLAGQWPCTRIVILVSLPGGRHRKNGVPSAAADVTPPVQHLPR
jgi:hypothetical protein